MRCADCPEVPNGTHKRPVCCQRLPTACIDSGHLWTDWSPWRATTPDGVDRRPIRDDAKPVAISYKAVRDRRCERCGCVEQQSKDGTIEVVEDPNGVESQRARPAQ